MRANCNSSVDKGGRCYRCGEMGHAARFCEAKPRYPICADHGKANDHRISSKTCMSVKGGKRTKSLARSQSDSPTPGVRAGGNKADMPRPTISNVEGEAPMEQRKKRKVGPSTLPQLEAVEETQETMEVTEERLRQGPGLGHGGTRGSFKADL